MRAGWSGMNTANHRWAAQHPALPGTASPSTQALLILHLVTGVSGSRTERKNAKTLVCLLFSSIRRQERAEGL